MIEHTAGEDRMVFNVNERNETIVAWLFAGLCLRDHLTESHGGARTT